MDSATVGATSTVGASGLRTFLGRDASFLFRNNGDLTFTEVQSGSGFDHTGQGRSLMTLDYDKDGDLDVLITAYHGPVALYRNDLSGSDINWLQIRLDTDGDPGLASEGRGSRARRVGGDRQRTPIS